MAFWGVEIKPGKPFTHQYDASRGRLHVSMATLGLGTAITKSTLQCNVGNKSPVLLCALYPGKSESLQLNLEFEEDGNVVLSVIGPRSIHLCGYYLARGHYTNTMGESESYGEDIADTETERSEHSDEDDYDDSFIDDDGDTVFPPSPIFNEEEASSDSGRKVTKGSRRRLRKKYQLVESDDDGGREEKKIVNANMQVESQETDDEDSLPISSICKNKASGRVLDQEMDDDNVDKEIVDAANKEGENCEDSIIETKLKTDNVVADCQTHREAEPSDQLVDPSTVLDAGDTKKSKKKKKEKEKETKTSCNGQSIESDNAVQDEPKMNTTQDLLAGNEQNQQQADDKKTEPSDQLGDPCTVLDVGDIKKSKKKKKEKEKETKSSCNGHSSELGNAVLDEQKLDMTQDLLAGNEQNQQQADDRKVETMDKILPSSQVGQGKDEKPKRKRKERSKDETLTAGDASISNVINPPHGNEHNSQDTVNGDVKISDTVALPSLETDSQKKTKRRKKEHLNKASQPEGDNGNGEAKKETVESNSLIDKFSERKEQHPKLTIENNVDNNGNQSEDKKVKKKKKSKSKGNEVVNSDVPLSIEPSTEIMKEDGNNTEDAKSSQVRTLSDGLVIQELESGKANGKIAASGKKISINYTGKLKENGVVVESNAGEAPFKFRLGKGEVIKGWDIGLEGMHVGEKRRVVIPPSMMSKKDGDSGSIPPNSWLVYDFELVKVH